MLRTSNLRVRSLTPIIAPNDLKQVFPLGERGAEFVTHARESVTGILHNRDARLMVVVGPCSIHDPNAALEYAGRLAGLAREVEDQLFLVVMRVYFEKPRTTVGWKGLINDPDLDGTHRDLQGAGHRPAAALRHHRARSAGRRRDARPITPQYLADLITWGAIGARTTESQTHREMASGLSFPVGFKNGTDGNLQIASDAMKAAGLHPQLPRHQPRGAQLHRLAPLGNQVMCTSSCAAATAAPTTVAETSPTPESQAGQGQACCGAIMVDCSHANCAKDHARQAERAGRRGGRQIRAGNRSSAA